MRLVLLVTLLSSLAANAGAGGSGGGAAQPAPPAGGECVSPAELALARAAIARAVGAARALAPGQVLTTQYADPMPGGINSFGRTIVNYVDLNPTASLLDWNCGATTYDGHSGTDIEIRDFYDMDAGVPVLCAAPGQVVYVHDGEFDRQTQWLSGVTANSVIVQHADGTQAWYWHMRKGSVRVAMSQVVATGDTLGFVGSSGFSSGPHLHFETQLPGTRDPFSGGCQAASSLWLSQGPYVWTYPVQLFNSGMTTIPASWPLICERPPSKTHVVTGSTVYIWLRARNLQASNLLTYQFYSPAGSYATYSFYPSGSYSSSWWYVYWTLAPPAGLYGAWHVDILIDGTKVSTQNFTLDAQPNQLPTILARQVQVPVNGSVDVDLAGQDPDGSVFWHNLAGATAHGQVVLSGTRRHLLHYVPTPGFTGLDSVLVQAQDDEQASGPASAIRFSVQNLSAVDGAIPNRLRLAAIAPNPAGPGSRVSFELPQAADARIDVLDVSGRRVAGWRGASLEAGPHELAWRTLVAPRSLPAGLYFVRLVSRGAASTRRVSITE